MESAIVAGMGLDTPLHQKSLKTNLENIAGDMFPSTTEQKMILMPCPKLFNCRFRASGQDGWTRFSKIFLGRQASTYATLPSFTNLKRWRITTEAMCILCSKDVRTTAHIFVCYHYIKEDIHSGMTSISFCYSLILKHSVLCQMIEALKTFISNKKEAVLISAMSSIKFVKKELKALAKGVLQLAFSIMHQTGYFEQILIVITVSQSTLPSLN